MERIKKLKSGLTSFESEIQKLDEEPVNELKEIESDFIIKKLEENIKLRETPVLKKLVKK